MNNINYQHITYSNIAKANAYIFAKKNRLSVKQIDGLLNN